jgi:hypothetical protein
MPALVAGIHVFAISQQEDVDGRVKRAFTPVFDGLCPAMTMGKVLALNSPVITRSEVAKQSSSCLL